MNAFSHPPPHHTAPIGIRIINPLSATYPTLKNSLINFDDLLEPAPHSNESHPYSSAQQIRPVVLATRNHCASGAFVVPPMNNNRLRSAAHIPVSFFVMQNTPIGHSYIGMTGKFALFESCFSALPIRLYPGDLPPITFRMSPERLILVGLTSRGRQAVDSVASAARRGALRFLQITPSALEIYDGDRAPTDPTILPSCLIATAQAPFHHQFLRKQTPQQTVHVEPARTPSTREDLLSLLNDWIIRNGAQAALADGVLAQRDARRLLDAALATIPDRERTSIKMRYFDDCKVSEIAHRLDVGPARAREILNKAFRYLKHPARASSMAAIRHEIYADLADLSFERA